MKHKKLTTTLFLSSTLFSGAVMTEMTSATAINVPAQHIQLTQEWDKVFPKSDKVEHHKVTFKNRYGITLAADLYMPKNAQDNLPAIAVGGPFGAVKEQVSGLYAQTLAERGFVTLAFDGSFTGESSGLPRNSASPEINTEDFSAAVDFLGSLDNVNREEIGILGVCGWGGFALNAAVSDTRIKAVATSTMYDMTRVMAKGYNDSIDAEARYKMKRDLNNTRWQAVKNDYANTSDTPVLPEVTALNVDTPKFVADYVNFYKTKRAYHARSVGSTGAWTTTTPLAFINMPILQYAQEMKTPALIVHGEKAHSRYFSEDVFNALGSQDKELYIVPNATHGDLYDNQANKIPFDKFEQFFKAKLK
ncbi:alpha/beta hydrolase [[Pasteurella] aerogenes]